MDTLIEPLYIKFILHTTHTHTHTHTHIYIYIYIYCYNNGLFKRERDNKRNQREEVEVVVKRAFQDQGERKRDNERGVERGSEGGYEIERKLNNGYVLNIKKKKKLTNIQGRFGEEFKEAKCLIWLW